MKTNKDEVIEGGGVLKEVRVAVEHPFGTEKRKRQNNQTVPEEPRPSLLGWGWKAKCAKCV